MMIAATIDRVAKHTTPTAALRIRELTNASLRHHRKHPEDIPQRLRELDREWDIERVLATGSSSLTLFGLLFGIAVHRKWLLLSLGVQGFFLQHALEGWCPPLPLLRRCGVRTAQEIESERCSLLAILEKSRLGGEVDADTADEV
jgi:hypothetical protein